MNVSEYHKAHNPFDLPPDRLDALCSANAAMVAYGDGWQVMGDDFDEFGDWYLCNMVQWHPTQEAAMAHYLTAREVWMKLREVQQ